MTQVGIVVDSTCDLGPAWCEANDVVHVPLKVLFGETSYLDWTELGPDEFYRKLAESPTLPKTSQPSPADFAAAYEGLAARGVDEIVSIHLTAELSGTCESAQAAAGESKVPVRVVDTRLVSQAVGLVAKAAVAARATGADAQAIEDVAVRVAGSCRIFFIPDTLEYLVKGGRAGKAQGLAASLLDIKPVLTFKDGVVEPFKKVKGRRKAMAELAAHVAADTAGSPARAALLHAAAPDRADELRVLLEQAGANVEIESSGYIGAVIGTYAGPGCVGFAYYPVD